MEQYASSSLFLEFEGHKTDKVTTVLEWTITFQLIIVHNDQDFTTPVNNKFEVEFNHTK